MKIHIGKSKTHGWGVFASRDIKIGELLFIMRGKKVSFLIDNQKKADAIDYDIVGLGKNIWLNPRSYVAYINHSCKPNAGIRGKIKVVALCDIKKDEEVTMDYSLSESDIFWGFKCSCGVKTCRKSVKSIQFIPKQVLRERQLYIPDYFKKILKRFHISKFKDRKELEHAWLRFIKSDFKV